MRPHGTIYKTGQKPRGQVFLHLPLRTRVVYHFLRGIGLGLITAAVAGFILAYSPIIGQEAGYTLKSAGIMNQSVDYSAQIAKASETDAVQKEAQELDLDPSFSIVIPKIDARSNVIANVDTGNEAEYLAALKNGVAHAKGTYFPGQGKPIFLFAHSTNAPLQVARLNAVFYLLSKLEENDSVILYFADKKYFYTVTGKKVIDKDDTSYLYDQNNKETLYLMTCTPPGTTWKRLIVTAEPTK